jgi:hypothetical protein
LLNPNSLSRSSGFKIAFGEDLLEGLKNVSAFE